MSVERRYPALKHTHTADQIEDLSDWLTTWLDANIATPLASHLSAAFTTTFGASDSTKFFRGDKTWANQLDGPLITHSASANELLRLAGSSPYMTWYSADQTTRYGYIQHGSTDLYMVNERNGRLVFYTNNAQRGYIESSGDFRWRGIGRFTGWYNTQSSDENGQATEVGVSGSLSYVGAYNRTASTYHPLYIFGSNIVLQPQSSNVVVAGTSASPTLDVQSLNGSPWGLRLYRTDLGSGAQMYWDGAFEQHSTAVASNGPILASSGWVQTTGWSGVDSYRQGGQFGYTGGFVYVHAYNGASYLPIRIAGSTVDINQSDLLIYSKIALRGNDTWLRLNPTSAFTSGIYSPGLMRVDGELQLNSVVRDVTNAGSLFNFNRSALSYGTAYITGSANGGYHGLTIYDGVYNMTLMSSGSSRGIYDQGVSKWFLYNDTTYNYLGQDYPMRKSTTTGGMVYHASTSYVGGAVFVQSGGSPSGGADGDIFLIY